MPISGIVFFCSKGGSEQVAQFVSSKPGFELPGDLVIAVVEANSVNDEIALVSDQHQIEG